MDLFDRNPEPQLATRPHTEEPEASEQSGPRTPSIWLSPRRLIRLALIVLLTLGILGAAAFFGARTWLRDNTRASLPQVDGTLQLPALAAPVTVERDKHGIPHIHAQSIDDLLIAQGFVTASDRLFQMDLLRRHAAGELAEILGPSLLPHDRLQRTLQIRASADRAIAVLPPDQQHMLGRFAVGVNASIAQQTGHLPIEFRILRYKPAPWTPRDSLLVALAMFQDLTNTYPSKIARASLTAQLPPELQAELTADLYPVGSWRDHPPTMPVTDLTVPGPPIEEIPLDESQSELQPPAALTPPATPPQPTFQSLLTTIQPLVSRSASCDSCTPGSNNWVVSGAHTASGKPVLSNDMHLAHSIPGLWYQADLSAPSPTGEPFHVAGVTIPGLPLIVVGHNAHIAWGFTNLGADVQDLYIETLRGIGPHQEFRGADGTWQPVVHAPESINLKGSKPIGFDVALTRHGDTLTPILNPTLTAGAASRIPALSLRWTIYDPTTVTLPQLAVDSAHDWPSFLAAFSTFGGPSQNVVYADDQGHIGYHAIGRVPLRGAPAALATSLPADIATPVAPTPAGQTPVIAANPDPLSHTDILAPPAPTTPQLSGPISPVPSVPTAAREWTGYIPFDQLPQVLDPAGGVIATANARTTPDDYRYPITLNWTAPYRNERIWRLLGHRTGLTVADMLPIQTDVYSDLDHVLAQRFAYAIDNSLAKPSRGLKLNAAQTATLKQAADLLRSFNGRMTTDSPAAAIVGSTRQVLWPMLLGPQLRPARSANAAAAHPQNSPAATADEVNNLYLWGEKDYALEQILMHTPPRWLPKPFATWDDFLTAAIERGLTDTHAPQDLTKWRYGAIHTLDIEHPIFEQSPALTYLFGLPTGTGSQPQSGDGTTIKQVGRTFGPSERFTADLADPDRSTLNLVVGESGNPMSPWFLDQFQAWYHGTTFPFPFTSTAAHATTTHTLTLTPTH